jgi:hypothetical protein
MNDGKPKAGTDYPRALPPAGNDGPNNLSWSIRRLIELLDEAIDTAGAQLARSAGLWADSATPFDERDRPSTRRRSHSSLARSASEESDRDRGIDLM